MVKCSNVWSNAYSFVSSHLFTSSVIRFRSFWLKSHVALYLQAVNEAAIGVLSQESLELINSLSRPLDETVKPVYLFSTNFEVDDYNEQQLMEVNIVCLVFLHIFRMSVYVLFSE